MPKKTPKNYYLLFPIEEASHNAVAEKLDALKSMVKKETKEDIKQYFSKHKQEMTENYIERGLNDTIEGAETRWDGIMTHRLSAVHHSPTINKKRSKCIPIKNPQKLKIQADQPVALCHIQTFPPYWDIFKSYKQFEENNEGWIHEKEWLPRIAENMGSEFIYAETDLKP